MNMLHFAEHISLH